MDHEISVMRKLGILQLDDYGSFTDIDSSKKENDFHYLIMPRYTKKLENCTDLDTTAVLEIGLTLIQNLEQLHDAGFVHNGLNPSNVMYDNSNKVHLIDYKFASSYTGSSYSHIKQNCSDNFRGNLYFASTNQLQIENTSRRDDCISLCYLLVFLLDGQEYIGIDESMTFQEQVDIMLDYRSNQSVRQLCSLKS